MGRLELLAAAARLPLPGGSLAVPGRAAELEWAEVADYYVIKGSC